MIAAEALPTGPPSGAASVDDVFFWLVYADEDLLRAEFDAIVATAIVDPPGPDLPCRCRVGRAAEQGHAYRLDAAPHPLRGPVAGEAKRPPAQERSPPSPNRFE